jgi:4-hydroxybenzoate polyprenyltransferase
VHQVAIKERLERRGSNSFRTVDNDPEFVANRDGLLFLHPREQNPVPSSSVSTDIPLVVDLDGTLVKTDLLIESLLVLIKHNPLYILLLPIWLIQGKAYFKQQVGRRVTLDVCSLPYNVRLLEYLCEHHEKNRRLVLATAADRHIAYQLADYLQLFDAVFASDGVVNLSSENKRARLIAEFGEKGFDYAGNDRCDLVVWSSARKAILVNPERNVLTAAKKSVEVVRVFKEHKGRLRLYLRELRLYQWIKNILVFVPLLAAHRIDDPILLTQAVLAFVAFGLCASSVYVLNDLLDLQDDRRHPQKRQRPLAAGDLSLLSGLRLIPILLALSIAVSLWLPPSFLVMLGAYYTLTLAYSLYIRRMVLMDVIVLAALFTMRVLAGSAAVSIWASPWLLAFCMFLFISLALIKRYAELTTIRNTSGKKAKARGYIIGDRELLAAMGSASGFLSVLVLVLYISNGPAHQFYGRHHILWLVCPFLFFWLGYLWLVAHRGAMHHDPLVFSLRDRISRVTLFLMGVITVIAT